MEDAHPAPARGAGGRGLSTARAVLQVQDLLARTADGVRAEDVATAVGKSVSTAYNLLASLCDAGVASHRAGVYQLSADFRERIGSGSGAPPLPAELGEALEELFARTHKRSYLALVVDGRLRIVGSRGLQGMPRLRGLDPEIGAAAHALALGKVALAFGPPARLQHHLAHGLRAFTPHTITRPDALLVQLAAIRAGAIAADRQEFDERVWNLAVPLLDARRRLLGAMAVTVSARSARAESEPLAATLSEVAERLALPPARRFQASDEINALLDHLNEADLASRGVKVSAPHQRRHGA